MNGYCILILGGKPTYRIVFKNSLPAALKAVSNFKENGRRIEVLEMLNGDTILGKENLNEYSQE